MRRVWAAVALLALLGPGAAAPAATVLDEAEAAFARIQDYTATVHADETDGKNVQVRTYAVAFKRPSWLKIDVLAGPDRGAGIVWAGGNKIRGHSGGMLGAIKVTLDVHDPRAASLRGDGVEAGTFGAMLADFHTIPGRVSESSGPAIESTPSDTLTLEIADPASHRGVTREVLYLSRLTHLPLRRMRFAGDTLVKTETIVDLRTNVGLTTADFPF